MADHDDSEGKAFDETRHGHRRARRHGRGRREAEEVGFNDVAAATSAYFQAFLNVAKGQAAYFADRYKNETAQVVDDFATSLRQTTEKRGRQSESGELIDDVASSLDELSAAIRDLKISAALSDVERLARQKPTTLVLASIAAGFILSRATMGPSRSSSPGPEDEELWENPPPVRRRKTYRRGN